MMPMGDRCDEPDACTEIDDELVDAVLAGGAVVPELEPVAEVVGALKDAAARPAPPRPELAVRMATATFGRYDRRQPVGVPVGSQVCDTLLVKVLPSHLRQDAEAHRRLAAKAASVGLAVVPILGDGYGADDRPGSSGQAGP